MAGLEEFQRSTAELAKVASNLPRLVNNPKDLAAAIKRAEAQSQKLGKIEEDLAQFEDKLAQEQKALQAMKDDLAVAQAKGLKVRTRLRAIASKERNIAKITQKSISPRQAQIARAKKALAETEEKMANMRLQRGLSKAELLQMKAEGRLPQFNDKINGWQVTTIFEKDHVAEILKKLFPDKNYAQDTPLMIPNPYAKTTWGVDFNVGTPLKKAFFKPDFAILDPKTAEFFEAKWFVKPGGGVRPEWLDELVDSVEKGRLAQFQLIRQQRIDAKLSTAFNDLWNEVYSKPLYVVTPVELPQSFQNLLKASVRGAGKNVHFLTAPVDLAQWALSLPD